MILKAHIKKGHCANSLSNPPLETLLPSAHKDWYYVRAHASFTRRFRYINHPVARSPGRAEKRRTHTASWKRARRSSLRWKSAERPRIYFVKIYRKLQISHIINNSTFELLNIYFSWGQIYHFLAGRLVRIFAAKFLLPDNGSSSPRRIGLLELIQLLWRDYMWNLFFFVFRLKLTIIRG